MPETAGLGTGCFSVLKFVKFGSESILFAAKKARPKMWLRPQFSNPILYVPQEGA